MEMATLDDFSVGDIHKDELIKDKFSHVKVGTVSNDNTTIMSQ